MRQLEDFMNRLTDMDWGWWPVVCLRPPKDKDIDNKVLLQISPVFGSMLALIVFFWFLLRGRVTFSVAGLVAYLVAGCVVFFILYKVSFAYFLNCRARRLRTARTQNENVA